ncbi:MAG: DUF285 domain-containing protein [Methylococcales bacterium]|nr:DUF285 domain-containing protein [Methylococcales bacterium]
MFNINYLLSFSLLLFSPFSNAVAVTATPNACLVTRTIQANQWYQIGIPCEAPTGQNTVAAIFGDDIPGTYDTDWVLYSYNPTTNAYEKTALTDTLEVGKGYWVISVNQITTLKMPHGSQPVNVQSSSQCSKANCFESTLATTGSDQYQMLANPFEYFIEGKDLRVNTGTSVGLTLAEADTNGVVANKLLSFNGSINVELQNLMIEPWTGFWIKTLSSASINQAPSLLFPTTKVSTSAPITRQQLKAMIGNGADVTQVNTSQITNMSRLFEHNASFNQDISNWDVSNVTTMYRMFRNAKNFNQNISDWNVSNVINMSLMFKGASSFNQDISNWNMSNVINISGMFASATSFNQDISHWDVGNVTHIYSMFKGATSFTNQNLSNWKVLKVIYHEDFFTEVGPNNIEPKWS